MKRVLLVIAITAKNGQAVERRALATAKQCGSCSMPMKQRPSKRAATPVVPEPINGSRMTSLGGTHWMRSRMSMEADGCVDWREAFVVSSCAYRQRLPSDLLPGVQCGC